MLVRVSHCELMGTFQSSLKSPVLPFSFMHTWEERQELTLSTCQGEENGAVLRMDLGDFQVTGRMFLSF